MMVSEVEMPKKNVQLRYLKVLKQEERFGLRFYRLQDRKKGTTQDFSS